MVLFLKNLVSFLLVLILLFPTVTALQTLGGDNYTDLVSDFVNDVVLYNSTQDNELSSSPVLYIIDITSFGFDIVAINDTFTTMMVNATFL